MNTYPCSKCGTPRDPKDLELISEFGKGSVICKDGCPPPVEKGVGQVWEG